MFSTVRYFVKTSIIFLIVGILTGFYMLIAQNILKTGFTQDLISAHTHIILVGSIIMMIMGVALWFFPRAEKTDKRYNPNIIWTSYWMMTIATSLRYIFQVTASLTEFESSGLMITFASFFQALAVILFFYSMWGRIRPIGSHIREAKGEEF